ncbi:thyroid adenoma-associated protein isoform X2 [Rhinichthys klamathensis goyatoka]|uniref:thyroid adenoma-associated protein isoform X2 n=1 Tax=Rhinichthys klamathensis goyatoka TaxID=3034132 RepID=UPI0024B59524|nr:thyroid adenoma-associated protein isoform X2 [Rhinichthys klamathensis goyatoka]
MVVKKKTPKVEAVVLDYVKLKSLTDSLSVEGDSRSIELAQVLKDSLSSPDPVEQIQLISKAGVMLEQLREDESSTGPLLHACLSTLAFLYTTLPAKNPLKRAVASALHSGPDWLEEKTVGWLSECLSSSLSSTNTDHFSHLTDSITSCLDGFKIGEKCVHRLLTEVLQFFQRTLNYYVEQNRGLAGRHVAQAQLMQSCLAVVKASMLVVQRSQEPISSAMLSASSDQSDLHQVLCGLLNCYTCILTDEEFLQTVQSTAGMAVVLFIRSIMGNGDDVPVIVAGLLQCSVDAGDTVPQWLRLSCAGLYDSSRPAAVALYLSHGALAMLSWRGKTHSPQTEKLLLLIPEVLLSLDTRVKESSTVMVVARVLTLWSGLAVDCVQVDTCPPLLRSSLDDTCPPLLRSSLVGGSPLIARLHHHIYAHWEHPLDGVRHQTRTLFQNLLKIHQHCSDHKSDPTTDPYISQLTRDLLALEWHMKGKYGTLACLVEHLGADYLLKLDGGLPSRLLGLMGDQTLAPYASDLLEKLFVSHKAQLCVRFRDGHAWIDGWHKVWVTPLLQVLCTARLDQTTYILDYFLPKLLRCNPSSLSHMVQALQEMPSCTEGAGSRGALGALMTCLRAARSQGVLRSDEEELWGGLVSLPLMRQALVHKHDQVRMDALGLLCESHRSTEKLSRKEMELIRHFLPFNLNSQSPGVRQQTVSLLKKLLCRVKDSAQLLQKRQEQHENDRDQQVLNMYQEFLCWFCETLFQVLHPGASFSRCLMALHLLLLIAELFTFNTGSVGFALGESVSVAHAQAVLYCLANNFLEVKQLACNLLQKLPPAAVRLQEPERLQSLLQVALNLSTSTKPFDSVTAAHLLNLLLHQPGLQDALLGCIQEQNIPLRPPALNQSQVSEASTLEQNTLAVVQWLMICLKEEILKAESSLLQASACCPLYGRAHCITAVLQQLNTGSLALLSQWRAVVSELIGLCYRMSDVVSPVVQSSSPEGLIPMDTESETSADLQKILQEIQPRDSNDFFTSARELDPSETSHNSEQKEPENEVHKQQICNTGGSDGEAYRVTAQMVLVCCWRTMKEVSMLLGHLCQSMNLYCPLTHPDSRGVITEDQVEGVGKYFREQLLQSRHRGAFELAYVGFVRLTEMLCRSGSATLQQLPSHWLKEVLEEVKSSDPSSKLCATRRSAGIPFYIQALLSSEPKSSSCGLLKMTMRSLTALAMPSNDGATESSTVPQVHALNILRALYRDTRLGENIVPFVSEGMQAAILGFTSPVWAVRNSSTLLFSTLITRIFGVKKGKDEHSKKNRMTGREFFTRFPALYPFLLSQLQEAAASVNSDSGQVKLHPSLFLLLLVLGRLYPSPMDGSSSPLGLAPFMPLIIRCGRSAVYRTREMAARALVPFVLVTQVPSTIQTLLEELPEVPGPGIQQNHIHGTLLQVLSLLRSYLTDTHRPQSENTEDCDLSSAIFPRLWLATRRNLCLVTRGAFLDLLGCLCGCIPVPVSESPLKKLREETLHILMASELVAPQGPDDIDLSVPGATQYLQSLAHIAISVCVESPHLWECPEADGFQRDLLERLLQCPHYEVRLFALEQFLKRLQRTEDKSQHCGQGPLPFELSVSSLTSLALHETYPACQAKVLQVLAVLPLSSLLPWRDGMMSLSCQEVLEHLLTLLETSTYSVELYCATLSLTSQLVVHLAESTPQELSEAAVVCLSRWGALVLQSCGEEQPAEVKLMSAEVLVKAVPTLLTAPALPLGITHTVALWKCLFTLLQDEDQDVRDGAADFTCYIPISLHNTGVATGAVSPPVALEMGVGLLCQLFQMWDHVAAGVVNLIEWLLGDEQLDTHCAEAPDLDEEFLFEKGDLNLWAEPLLWARMLHGHLSALLRVAYSPGVRATELDRLSAIANSNFLTAQSSMKALPALFQFSATIVYGKTTLLKERTSLAQSLLETLG